MQTVSSRRALCVGINQYANLSGANLSGCANDANDLALVLRDIYGFGYVEIMLDSEASRRGIFAGLDRLCAGARAGDELVFSFSGHGTQKADTDGDEADRLDEALCPADLGDANWNRALIIDDELQQYFARLPEGANLTIIADCCHSGTVMRQIVPEARRISKFLPSRFRRPIAASAKRRSFADSCKAGMQAAHVLLSGCRDHETSADACFSGRYNGALTWALLQAVRENPDCDWFGARRAISALLTREGHAQHPALSGREAALGRAVFGGRR